jgi:hypothetical protein
MRCTQRLDWIEESNWRGGRDAMLLNRREFTGLGVALGSFMGPLGCIGIDAGSGATSSSERMVRFRDGTVVPALGQGSARLALGRHPKDVEEEALRTGLSLGMTLIDTSDDYSGGRSEKFIGDVNAGQRDRVFLASLSRLGTNQNFAHRADAPKKCHGSAPAPID